MEDLDKTLGSLCDTHRHGAIGLNVYQLKLITLADLGLLQIYVS